MKLPMNFQISLNVLATTATLLGGTAVLLFRIRSSNRPMTVPRIIMPPIGMSTGFIMFASPLVHIPWSWAIAAFLAGLLFFAYPLIRTSRLERKDGQIYMKQSKMFMLILFGLLVIRLVLHDVVQSHVSIPQTGALFFLLAFGMIGPWRLAMLRQFLKLRGPVK
ncbi:CcdC family protein [Paenibacillus sp. y28]|uniref:CcdC family protein n=1 Tax=Paenibacillus sp. y28 TaxID=3129110 RepID=UPI00301796E6